MISHEVGSLEHGEVGRLVDSSPDGLLVVSEDGLVRYANPTAERLLGAEDGGLLGTSFGFPLGGEVDERVEVRRPGGAHDVVHMRVTPVTAEGEQRWVVALRPAPELPERAHDDPQPRAGHEQSRDDTLAVTSHELRNPMSALTGYIDVLALNWDGLSDDERYQNLVRIQRISRRLQLVVSRFLSSAQIEANLFPPQPQPTRVLDVLLEGLPELGEHAGMIDVRIPEDCVVGVHSDHLWSVLSNALLNAFRHGKPPVVVTAAQEHDWVVTTVADHGPGVPPELADRLFERYVRGGSESGGTGLGLWITRSIARAYGGEAWYAGNGEPGAQFRCRLPAATMEPAIPEPR